MACTLSSAVHCALSSNTSRPTSTVINLPVRSLVNFSVVLSSETSKSRNFEPHEYTSMGVVGGGVPLALSFFAGSDFV